MGRRGYTHASDHNTKAIVAALRKAGHEVHYIDRPVDLLVAIRGVWVLVEVKQKRGRLTESQQKFFATTRGPAFVIRSVEEALSLSEKIPIHLRRKESEYVE